MSNLFVSVVFEVLPTPLAEPASAEPQSDPTALQCQLRKDGRHVLSQAPRTPPVHLSKRRYAVMRPMRKL
jgi:hypothetical protein